MKRTYGIDVDCANCANCANKMERAAAQTEGVASAVVNFMTQKLTVEFCEGAEEKTVMAKLVKNCRRVVPDGEILL